MIVCRSFVQKIHRITKQNLCHHGNSCIISILTVSHLFCDRLIKAWVAIKLKSKADRVTPKKLEWGKRNTLILYICIIYKMVKKHILVRGCLEVTWIWADASIIQKWLWFHWIFSMFYRFYVLFFCFFYSVWSNIAKAYNVHVGAMLSATSDKLAVC